MKGESSDSEWGSKLTPLIKWGSTNLKVIEPIHEEKSPSSSSSSSSSWNEDDAH